jgi:hypothetical protein
VHRDADRLEHASTVAVANANGGSDWYSRRGTRFHDWTGIRPSAAITPRRLAAAPAWPRFVTPSFRTIDET